MSALVWVVALALGGVGATVSGPVEGATPATRAATVQVGPAPVLVPEGSSCPQWYGLSLDAGWSPEQWPEVDHIMWRESRCIPTATHRNANGTVDRGLLQINSIHTGWLAADGITPAMLLDPFYGLRAARLLYERDGWAPWRA